MRPPARPRRTAQVGSGRSDATARPRPAAAPGRGAPPPTAPTGFPPRTPSARPEAAARGTDDRDGPRTTRGPADVAGWSPVRPAVVSARSAERFAERVRMRRTVLRRRVVLAASGVAALGTLAWLLLVSPVLALDAARLTVAGDGGVVDPADVVAVVAAHDGVPLPRLDTVGLRRELLAVPGVRGAEVARDWPHGLRVELVAREPVAAVPLAEGGTALLDRDGVRVGRADELPAGLPLVEVPLEDGDARALTAVLTVLEQLPPELSTQVAGVSARSRDTVTLVLVDGQTVEWGSADRTALKAEVLLTLRGTGAAASASVVDVSAPTLPITRS